MTIQKVLVLLGILAVGVMGIGSVRNVLLVSLCAGILVAIGALHRIPREVLWVSDAKNTSIAQRLRNLLNPPTSWANWSSGEKKESIRAFAPVFMGATLVVSIIMQVDVWVIASMLDIKDVGIYNAATRVALPLSLLLASIETALWPRVASAHSSISTETLTKRVVFVGILGLGIGFAYAFTVPRLVPILFGAGYAGGIDVSTVLCLRFAFSLFVNPLHMVGYNFGLAPLYLAINILQLVAIVVLNIFFIPIFGILGAAVALLINDVLGFCIVLPAFLIKVRRKRMLKICEVE